MQFAIGVKRTAPVLAAAAAVPEHEWIPAVGMEPTQIAAIDDLPGAWRSEGVHCIARLTRIPVGNIPSARARKRRTIGKEQLTLAPPVGWSTCTGTATS